LDYIANVPTINAKLSRGEKAMLREISLDDIDLVAGGRDFGFDDTRSYIPDPGANGTPISQYGIYRNFDSYVAYRIVQFGAFETAYERATAFVDANIASGMTTPGQNGMPDRETIIRNVAELNVDIDAADGASDGRSDGYVGRD
jgi:hypothetical protein